MDEPIIYRRWVSPELQSLILSPTFVYEKLKNALMLDDKDEFVRLVTNSEIDPLQNHSRYMFLREFTVFKILKEDAPQIGMAVLNYETGGMIDNRQILKQNGWTPLHIASATPAPKLVKCLIERGDPVDIPCDYAPLNLKQATPLDIVLEVIDTGNVIGCYAKNRPWTLRCSMFELFHYVCQSDKLCLEVIRLLVQNTQNKERVRKAFFDYANEGKFIKVAALFLAAPEFFLSTSLGGGNMSSIDELYLNLNSLDKTTDIQQGLSLLLDVFNLLGCKLVAYVRLNDPKVWDLCHEKKSGFFLREAADMKLGISSRDDYLLSLFKPVSQHAVEPPCIPPPEVGNQFYTRYAWHRWPSSMKREGIDIDYVNRKIPSLQPHEADYLRKAIDNKLSKMPNICTLFEGTTRMPNKGGKRRPSFPRPRSIELPRVWSLDFKLIPKNDWESTTIMPNKGGKQRPSLPRPRSIELPKARSFCTEAANVKCRLDFKLIPKNGWECTTRMPNKGGKQRLSFPRPRSIELWSARSFYTEAANVKCRLDFKLIPRNGLESWVMNPTKLESFISTVRQSRFPLIAKRLIK